MSGSKVFYNPTFQACLTTDHEVSGSIPGTSTNFKCRLGLKRGFTQPREDSWVAT